MRSDPELQDAVGGVHGERAIVCADAHRVKSTNTFEVQGRVTRVLLQQRPEPPAPPHPRGDGRPRRRAESPLDQRTVWTGRHATTRRGAPGPAESHLDAPPTCGDHVWGSRVGTTCGDHVWGSRVGTTCGDHVWVKAVHTNLLIVWVLTGFMGATYFVVPEESRAEIYSPSLAFWQLGLWVVAGLTAVIGYLFGWTAGNKLLEQPYIVKLAIVVVMLMFLFNILMTIRKAGRWTTTEAVLVTGLGLAALLYLPALISFDNYTISIFYRWWTIHLWVEGVWEMIQAGLLAYLLIRLSGADREVMEKWLYVIVGLVFIAGILGTAHHYYWVGVPRYWLPIGGLFSALEPLALFVMVAYAYNAMRRSGMSHPNSLALHWTIGSAAG